VWRSTGPREGSNREARNNSSNLQVIEYGIKSWKLKLFSPFLIARIEFKSFFLCYCVSACPSSLHFFAWGGFDYVDFELIDPSF
jgi:hypothetical protein